MGFTFIFSTYGLATNISLDTLLDIGGKETNYAKYAVGMFPRCINIFWLSSFCLYDASLLWGRKKSKIRYLRVEQQLLLRFIYFGFSLFWQLTT